MSKKVKKIKKALKKKPASKREQIEKCAKEMKGDFNAAKIAEKTGLDQKICSDYLWRLWKAGILKSNVVGEYKVA